MYKCSHWLTNYRIVGLVLLFAMSACADKPPSYFPLETGYSWHYQLQLTTMAGTEKQKYYVSSLPAQIIDGKTTYIHRSLTGTQILFRQTDAGVSRVGFVVADGASLKTVVDEYLVLPNNPQVGAEWDSVALTQTLTSGKPQGMQVMAKVPVKNQIESIDDVVKVPAGNFQYCIRLHTSGFAFNSSLHFIGRTLVEIDQTSWYAPGVGLVKSVLIETTTSDALSRGELIMELESFSTP